MSLDKRVRELLHYDPTSGIFTWRVATSFRARVGGVAGCLCKSTGYRYIGFDGVLYGAHRLAWLYMKGRWPHHEIDHKNLVRDDNRWSNLREATKAQQKANARPIGSNTSGAKGVSWDAQRERWFACIRTHGKTKFLGRLDTLERAFVAYAFAARKHFGPFARLSSGNTSLIDIAITHLERIGAD